MADLVHQAGPDGKVLWWALALGADATAIGASANVVVLGIAERNGVRTGFWEFTRYGLIVTLMSVLRARRTCGCAISSAGPVVGERL